MDGDNRNPDCNRDKPGDPGDQPGSIHPLGLLSIQTPLASCFFDSTGVGGFAAAQ